MKKLTLKKFIEASNIPATLIRSTVKQCNGWNHFIEYAGDVARHGASGGTFDGFIYYDDTCTFFARNKKHILEMAESTYKELGYSSIIEMLASFQEAKRCKWTQNDIINAVYTNKGEDKEQIQNLMAWYALEEVCRAYVDLIEQED